MTRFLLALTLICTVVTPSPAADEKSVYNPDEFTISYWCGPPANFLTAERFAEVKNANFTLAFPPCAGMSVEENRKMLDYCQQVGLKAIVMDRRMIYSIGGSEENKKTLDAIVKDYSDHPALLGYHIVDEPGAGAYPELGEVVAYLKKKDPKHPGFINLMPNWALDLGVLGTKTYDEYVRKFAEQVKPFVISYDHYSFMYGGGDRKTFFDNLDTVRRVSLDTKIPFWNIVLLTQHGDYRHLTAPEMRFEAMQTLAFGARGLLWFTYWMPEGVPASEGWKHSMINADGTRDPHYEMARAINADVKAIGDILCKAESVNVFPNDVGKGLGQSASPIVLGAGNLTLGIFRDREGKHLVLVANRDYKNATKTEGTIAAKDAAVEVFDLASGTWGKADMKTSNIIRLNIPAGDGVLLRW